MLCSSFSKHFLIYVLHIIKSILTTFVHLNLTYALKPRHLTQLHRTSCLILLLTHVTKPLTVVLQSPNCWNSTLTLGQIYHSRSTLSSIIWLQSLFDINMCCLCLLTWVHSWQMPGLCRLSTSNESTITIERVALTLKVIKRKLCVRTVVNIVYIL